MIKQMYVLDENLGPKVPVQIIETPGHVLIRCSSTFFDAAAVAGLNSSMEVMLAGGHWFQLWGGHVFGRNTIDPERTVN